jgi:hypothetical protein
VADQITPGLWWDDKTAAHCKLPPDGVVYHYHPISFVSWLNQQLIDAQPAAAIDGATPVPCRLNHRRSRWGRHVLQDAFVVDTCNGRLTLESSYRRFDAPECAMKKPSPPEGLEAADPPRVRPDARRGRRGGGSPRRSG